VCACACGCVCITEKDRESDNERERERARESKRRRQMNRKLQTMPKRVTRHRSQGTQPTLGGWHAVYVDSWCARPGQDVRLVNGDIGCKRPVQRASYTQPRAARFKHAAHGDNAHALEQYHTRVPVSGPADETNASRRTEYTDCRVRSFCCFASLSTRHLGRPLATHWSLYLRHATHEGAVSIKCTAEGSA